MRQTRTSPAGEDPREHLIASVRVLDLELERFVEEFARTHAVHRTDVLALGRLWQAEMTGHQLTPTRLATSMSLSPPATTAMLRRLEQADHVVRRPDPGDRRRSLLGLSDHARDVASSFFGPLAEEMRTALADVSDADVAVAGDVVDRLIDAIRRATGGGAGG